ncbi:MAG: hypothetical protein H8E55_58905 [Pelagibacterales bacterium]|nr:hypothetical protein [Pelagibacterales bacterium]
MKKSFYIICSVALIWNIIGIFNYLGFVYMSEEAFQSLPNDMQLYIEIRPSWVTGSFALAVFTATIGNIGLILRKKWANLLLIISLISVIAQTIYNFIIQDIVQNSETDIAVMVLVNLVAVFLVYYSQKMNT